MRLCEEWGKKVPKKKFFTKRKALCVVAKKVSQKGLQKNAVTGVFWELVNQMCCFS